MQRPKKPKFCRDHACLNFTAEGATDVELVYTTLPYPMTDNSFLNKGSYCWDFGIGQPIGNYPVVIKVTNGNQCQYEWFNVSFPCSDDDNLITCNEAALCDCDHVEFDVYCDKWGDLIIDVINIGSDSDGETKNILTINNNSLSTYDIDAPNFTIDFNKSQADIQKERRGDYVLYPEEDLESLEYSQLTIESWDGACTFYIPIDEYPCQGVFLPEQEGCDYFEVEEGSDYCTQGYFHKYMKIKGEHPIKITYGDTEQVFGDDNNTTNGDDIPNVPQIDPVLTLYQIGPLPEFYDFWIEDANGCKAHIIGTAEIVGCDFYGKAAPSDFILNEERNCKGDFVLINTYIEDEVELKFAVESQGLQQQDVSIRLQSLTGQYEILIFKDRIPNGQEQKISYNMRNLPAGMYLFSMQTSCGTKVVCKGIKL